MTEICFRDYFGDFLDSIFTSFTARQVKIEKDVEDICVSAKTAMSLGLIINEVATNAVKHGFSGKDEAVFPVKLNKNDENNQYELILSNTGKPFPENVHLENSETLGLRLIGALVAQIDGTIKLQKAPHPVFIIKFPEAEE